MFHLSSYIQYFMLDNYLDGDVGRAFCEQPTCGCMIKD